VVAERFGRQRCNRLNCLYDAMDNTQLDSEKIRMDWTITSTRKEQGESQHYGERVSIFAMVANYIGGTPSWKRQQSKEADDK
jgi:hypothetical protein